MGPDGLGYPGGDMDQLYRFAALIAEACAKVCEPFNVDDPSDWTEYARTRVECAAAIRAKFKE